MQPLVAANLTLFPQLEQEAKLKGLLEGHRFTHKTYKRWTGSKWKTV